MAEQTENVMCINSKCGCHCVKQEKKGSIKNPPFWMRLFAFFGKPLYVSKDVTFSLKPFIQHIEVARIDAKWSFKFLFLHTLKESMLKTEREAFVANPT